MYVYAIKGCDSDFEVTFFSSNFRSYYKGNIYLSLNNMYLNRA